MAIHIVICGVCFVVIVLLRADSLFIDHKIPKNFAKTCQEAGSCDKEMALYCPYLQGQMILRGLAEAADLTLMVLLLYMSHKFTRPTDKKLTNLLNPYL